MSPRRVITLATMLIVVTIALMAYAPLPRAEDVAPFKVPIPDCGVALCVLPKPVTAKLFQQLQDQESEIKTLKEELARGRPKCATVERTTAAQARESPA